MKRIKIIGLFLITIFLASCGESAIQKAKQGDIIVMDKDTFLVRIDTFTVISSDRVPPISIEDHLQPRYRNATLENHTFFTSDEKDMGDYIITKTLIKTNGRIQLQGTQN